MTSAPATAICASLTVLLLSLHGGESDSSSAVSPHHVELESMDFLSRLIAGSGPSPTRPRERPVTAAGRYQQCKKAGVVLQQVWRSGKSIAENEAAHVEVEYWLQTLNSCLDEELKHSLPYPCLNYIATSQIYIIVAKLAASAQHAPIVQATVHLFHTLIDGEVDGVLDSKNFARSLIEVVKTGARTGEQEEADLIELLFEICTKIKQDPDILPAWFYPERGHSDDSSTVHETARKVTSSHEQFPLFYQLVRHVHEDGAAGDFSRIGLLYLTETASKSKSLESWMIESDLAPQMASGLGALYSRLSRRSPALSPEQLPVIMKWSTAPNSDVFSESKRDGIGEDGVEFMQEVRTFLKYLSFWQDTLNHCSSPEVIDTLLDSFEILFVQQLLYPSLLESSDNEQGTTASVMAHLYRILDTLEHQELVQRLLRYLLASPQQRSPSARNQRRPRMSISRRKSMDKLAALSQVQNSPSPQLFSLVDLISMTLKSVHSRTVVASLKLISIILRKHHSIASSPFKLVRTDTPPGARAQLEDGLRYQFAQASQIGNIDATLDQTYGALLADVQETFEEHACTALPNADGFEQAQFEPPGSLRVAEDDPIMATVRALFTTFFTNDVLINLALTEVCMALASCRHIDPRSWLIEETTQTPHGLPGILDSLVRETKTFRSEAGDAAMWDQLFPVQKSRLLNPADPAESLDPSLPPVTSAPVLFKITNAIILQEFLLEIAAMMQLRASMFGVGLPDPDAAEQVENGTDTPRETDHLEAG